MTGAEINYSVHGEEGQVELKKEIETEDDDTLAAGEPLLRTSGFHPISTTRRAAAFGWDSLP